MIKREDIGIRDPFILPYEGKYYMFGTDNRTAWHGVSGFPCYISEDLENWEGPIVAFERPEGFWANDNFWAPEVHEYKGAFYMFASFYNAEKTRATQILRAEKPEGPYRVWSPEPITPADWLCLDGTFFVDDDGKPWMVFRHEWLQIGTGEICAVELSPDLTHPVGDPVTLFAADEAPWVTPNDPRIIAGNPCMVTDGPYIVREGGKLVMFWSSFSNGNYAEGIAVNTSGKITGEWIQQAEPLFDKDGGHGMLFETFDGKLMFSLHRPNNNPFERPCFFELERKNGTFVVKE